MRISDWSSDVCSSDLWSRLPVRELGELADVLQHRTTIRVADAAARDIPAALRTDFGLSSGWFLPLVADDHALGLLVVEPYEVDVAAEGVERIAVALSIARARYRADRRQAELDLRSEEHTSELQSLMRISYAALCLKKKQTRNKQTH